MKEVILMHGKDATPDDKWYPWLGEQMRRLGFEYVAPALPKTEDPVLEEWLARLDATDQMKILF